MQALVTGANGFVGSHVVDELLRRGHTVRCLVRATSDLRFLNPDRVEIVHGDMRSSAVPDEALHDVDVVFHNAGLVKALDRATYWRVNVEGTQALYEAWSQHLGDGGGAIHRFVFCSSLAAAGPSEPGQVLTEADAPRPISHYGASKLASERWLAQAAGPAVTVIRPPAVYGPRDPATLKVFQLARSGWNVCFGPGDRALSLVHAQDLAAGMVQAATQATGVGTWFLTDGEVHSWQSMMAAVAAGVGRSTRDINLPRWVLPPLAGLVESTRFLGMTPILTREKARDFTAPGWACSSAAATAAFGYEPRWTMERGMEETSRWYRDHGWLRS